MRKIITEWLYSPWYGRTWALLSWVYLIVFGSLMLTIPIIILYLFMSSFKTLLISEDGKDILVSKGILGVTTPILVFLVFAALLGITIDIVGLIDGWLQ